MMIIDTDHWLKSYILFKKNLCCHRKGSFYPEQLPLHSFSRSFIFLLLWIQTKNIAKCFFLLWVSFNERKILNIDDYFSWILDEPDIFEVFKKLYQSKFDWDQHMLLNNHHLVNLTFRISLKYVEKYNQAFLPLLLAMNVLLSIQ